MPLPEKTDVKTVNFFLQVDIDLRRTVSTEEFCKIVFDFQASEAFDTPIPPHVDEKIECYLEIAARAGIKEQDLYPSFLDVLKSIMSENEGDDEKEWYQQDPFHVEGSRVDQKPDFGLLYRALTQSCNINDLMKSDQGRRTFYGIVLAFSELKHSKGLLLEVKAANREQRFPRLRYRNSSKQG